MPAVIALKPDYPQSGDVRYGTFYDHGTQYGTLLSDGIAYEPGPPDAGQINRVSKPSGGVLSDTTISPPTGGSYG